MRTIVNVAWNIADWIADRAIWMRDFLLRWRISIDLEAIRNRKLKDME